MTGDDFRDIALGMQSAVERAHMEDRAVLMAWQAVTRM